jgi:predicted nucleotidyltransferase
MNSSIKPALENLKLQVKQSYGVRLSKVILYGSYARGDETKDSDIDLLIVLLDDKIDRLREIENLSDMATEILINYGYVVSALPFSASRLTNEKTLFTENVLREGIAI